MRELHREVEVELVDYVRVVDPEEVHVGVVGPSAVARVEAFHGDDVVRIHVADGANQPLGEIHPLLLGGGGHRLVHQVVAEHSGFIAVVARDGLPECRQAIPVLDIGPEGEPLAVRLVAALRDVHVQEEPDAMGLGPGHVLVDPGEAALFVLEGSRVVLEGDIVHVEPDEVHSHCCHARIVDLRLGRSRQRNVRPDGIAERDAPQSHRAVGVVDDALALHPEDARRTVAAACRAARREAASSVAAATAAAGLAAESTATCSDTEDARERESSPHLPRLALSHSCAMPAQSARPNRGA
jgi:hypothetical protein